MFILPVPYQKSDRDEFPYKYMQIVLQNDWSNARNDKEIVDTCNAVPTQDIITGWPFGYKWSEGSCGSGPTYNPIALAYNLTIYCFLLLVFFICRNNKLNTSSTSSLK